MASLTGTRTLRVVHLIARMPASGTERQLVGMVRAAKHHGLWEPTVGVLYDGFALTRELADSGIPTIEFGDEGGLDPRRALRLRRYLSDCSPHVMHTSLWGGSVYGRALALVQQDRPAVVMSERRVEDFRSAPKRAVDRPLRLITEAYIGNSQDVADFVSRAHGVSHRRVTVIPNGIDQETFRPREVAPTGPLHIGAVGRLVHQKGFDILLQALPMVLATRPDATLSIVGEGPLRSELTAAARDLPVTFRGALATPTKVAEYLHDLSVFAMPSRYEGLPNALLEAQACRVPSVASDAPGIQAAAGPGVLLCTPEDPRRLADAILAQADVGIAPPHDNARTFEDVALEHLDVFRRAHHSRNRR